MVTTNNHSKTKKKKNPLKLFFHNLSRLFFFFFLIKSPQLFISFELYPINSYLICDLFSQALNNTLQSASKSWTSTIYFVWIISYLQNWPEVYLLHKSHSTGAYNLSCDLNIHYPSTIFDNLGNHAHTNETSSFWEPMDSAGLCLATHAFALQGDETTLVEDNLSEPPFKEDLGLRCLLLSSI